MSFYVIIILLQNYGLVKDKVIFGSRFKVLKIKRLLSIFFFTLVAFFGMADLVFAASLSGIEYAEGTGLGNTHPAVIVAKIIQIALGFLGIIAIALIIYAGFLWMTSNGNEDRIAQAKTILKNAAIGLVIILSSFAIASFILGKLLSGESFFSSGGKDAGYSSGIGALGNGALKSVYPEPNQKEVPRNTSIVVTFREAIDPQTICQTSGVICSGENIVEENIRIFKTKQGDSCGTDCSDSNVVGVKVHTTDNKTFVFMPDTYLGSPSEYIWYSVNLSADIKKGDGNLVFPSFGSGYLWNFEVSNKIDLTPPQVLSGGVFPVPDNEKDDVGVVEAAVAATGGITVGSQPQAYVYPAAGIPVPQGASEAAVTGGTYNCFSNGTLTVSISDSMIVNVSGVSGVVGGDNAGDGNASLGCGLTLSPEDGTFTAGNSWTIAVTGERQADSLIIGKNLYTFVSGPASGNEITLGANTGATANNIKNALAAHPDLDASVAGNAVSLTAKVAGSAGNSIALSTTSSGSFVIVPMAGGENKKDFSVVKDKRDKPRNAVIQINFNEAMNPMRVSGTSEELADYIRVVNMETDEIVSGKFVVSNQYKTVEFVSDVECGRNACGEKIYCLPENSRLRVELKAANLTTCSVDSDCASRSPYTSCGGGICKEPATSVNFPLASTAFNGIMDMALNSLDGNRDNNAQGPASYYNENSADAGAGDNFLWSFFINDNIDLTSPLITSTDAANNTPGVNLSDPIIINFDKLMMSGSLSTGEVVVNNGKEDFTHKLVNLWSFSSQPVGYWVTNEGMDNAPLDGEADWTKAYISHTDFADATRYRAQVGSGVKDIYQNCFKPCDGPACSGESAANPSCCSGVTSAVDGVVNECAP